MSAPITYIPPQFQTPAPNRYNVKSELIRKTPPNYSFSSRTNQPNFMKNTPGPGRYTPKFGLVQTSKPEFSLRDRHKKPVNNNPGPGAHEVVSEKNPRSASLGARTQPGSIFRTPFSMVPVKFDEIQGKPPQFSFRAKRYNTLDEKPASGVIAGANYNPNKDFGKPTSQKFSLRSRTVTTVPERTPGPAKYGNQRTSFRREGFSFGSRNYQGFNIW